MRHMLGVLTLGTILATTAVAVHAGSAADLGLPPLDPMSGAAAFAPADEPDVEQALPPYRVQHEENKESGPINGSDQ